MASFEIKMSDIVTRFTTGVKYCADWAAKNIIENENKGRQENKLDDSDIRKLSKIAEYDMKVATFHIATAFAVAYLAFAYFGYMGAVHAAVKIGICLFVREVANQSLAQDNSVAGAISSFFSGTSNFIQRFKIDPNWTPDYLNVDTPWGKISLIKNPTLSWDKQFALFKEALFA